MRHLKKALSLLLALAMLLGCVTVTAFAEENCPSAAFSDVPPEGNWAHEGIDFMVKNEYMNGVGGGKFAPEGIVTRAQLVTILYRLDGSPETTFKNTFSDVADGKWYSLPIEWAAANAIVNGVGEGRFNPDGKITREQIAAILYRYSGSPKAEGDLNAFPDASSASNYARDALIWATQRELINGIASGSVKNLAPRNNATRAQIAAIVSRFSKLHTHDYKAEVTAPTCTEKGYTTYTCECGDSYKADETDALGHDYKAEVTAPTCTAAGFTTYTCARCNDSYKAEEKAALGHDWDEGAVTTQPTETAEGVRTFTCKRCGETRTEAIAKLPHVHSYVAAVTAPTCTEAGYTTYTCACGDSYRADETAALGHDWDEGTVVKPATTAEEGILRYTCRRCGETRDEAIPKIEATLPESVDFSSPSSIGKYTVKGTSSATQTESGLRLVTTRNAVEPCNGQNSGAQASTPEDLIEVPVSGDWVATLTFDFDQAGAANGYYQFFGFFAAQGDDYQNMAGIRCGNNDLQDFLRVGGEVTADTEGVRSSPGTNANGTYYLRIRKLGDSYTCYRSADGSEFTEMFGYDGTGIEADRIVIDAYTGMTAGYAYTVESLRFMEPDHKHSYTAVVTEPTCTAGGYTTYTCEGCGHSYVGDRTEALGHDYVDGVCTRCGQEKPNIPDELHWVSTWATAEENFTASTDRVPNTLNGTTVRQIIRVTTSGETMKLKFSNQYGTTDVVVRSLHIAKQVQADKSTIYPETDTVVTVGGAEEFVIPRGQTIETDPVHFPVNALENVAVSMYFGSAPTTAATITGHRGARATTYQGTGNQVSSETLNANKTILSWYFLCDVALDMPEGGRAIVCFGDSITDGYGTDASYLNQKPDQYTRWGDYFAKRLQADENTKNVSVLNEGIGSNGMLGSYPTDSGRDRYASDLLEHDGVEYVIILFGVNDLQKLNNTSKYEQLRVEFEKMITLAHEHGIKVYAAPILPFSKYSDYYSAGSEQVRTMLNDWFRSEDSHVDAIIDFESAVADPADPKSILPAYTSDGLHPHYGYNVMADAIDLTLFYK